MQYKFIFPHDNSPSHGAKLVRDTSEALSWEILPRAAYSPDLAPSDYHLLASMCYAHVEQRFDSYEDVKKWFDECFATKMVVFYWRSVHKLLERWGKCLTSDAAYFEESTFYRSFVFNVFFISHFILVHLATSTCKDKMQNPF